MTDTVTTVAVAHVDVLCPKCGVRMEKVHETVFCINPSCELWDKSFRVKTPVGQVDLEEIEQDAHAAPV